MNCGKGLGCLLTIALLWAGGQGVYEAVRNRAPESLSCEQAQKTPPRSAWVHLTGCSVNVMEAAYKVTSAGQPTDDIFIPLTAKEPGETKTVRFVLATKDPDIVAVVKEMTAVDGKDQSAFFAFLGKNANRLVRDKDVTGMVQSGISKNDSIHKRLRELNKGLVEDFVVIDEGREPALMWSLLLLAGGVIILLLFVARAGTKAKA